MDVSISQRQAVQVIAILEMVFYIGCCLFYCADNLRNKFMESILATGVGFISVLFLTACGVLIATLLYIGANQMNDLKCVVWVIVHTVLLAAQIVYSGEGLVISNDGLTVLILALCVIVHLYLVYFVATFTELVREGENSSLFTSNTEAETNDDSDI